MEAEEKFFERNCKVKVFTCNMYKKGYIICLAAPTTLKPHLYGNHACKVGFGIVIFLL